MGAVIARGRRAWCAGSPRHLLVSGAAVTLVVTVAAALAGGVVTVIAHAAGGAGVIIEALALTTMLSLRDLVRAAHRVQAALRAGDVDRARVAVGRDLVSRPTEALSAGQVAAATIESVAENLTDSVVAPVAFYLAFGLPGAFAYRALNTADAMIGYRQGALEYFGKVAARLDDVMNLVPARVAGLAIVLAAVASGAHAARAWRTMLGHHGRTASPNAGWPMAAMAGALGVRLEKPGHYILGDGPEPTAADISIAVRTVIIGAFVAVALIALAIIALRAIV
jgi:adenosylcobinamide-phosphate synthase